MKIGFFSPTINRIGGGEWVTVNMINSLKARGHEVVVCSPEAIDTAKILSVFGKKLDFDEEVNFWPSIFDPWDLRSIYPNALRCFFFAFKCDFLIDTFSNVVLPWVDAVYFQGLPRIFGLSKGLKGEFLLPYKALLTRANRTKEKILMTCSKFSARFIREATGLPVNVLYPPVSSFFRVEHVRSDHRMNVVVTVSRFAEEKNLEIVPQIAKLVSGNFLFIIAGATTRRSKNVLDSLLESIRKLKVDGSVKVLPNIPRGYLKHILRTSKAYLHTAQNEAFGISIVEAMSSGCIPVVPDSGGPKEFVPKHLRYKTIKEAAIALEKAVFDWSPKKAEKLVQSTKKFSEERFSANFLKIMNSGAGTFSLDAE